MCIDIIFLWISFMVKKNKQSEDNKVKYTQLKDNAFIDFKMLKLALKRHFNDNLLYY